MKKKQQLRKRNFHLLCAPPGIVRAYKHTRRWTDRQTDLQVPYSILLRLRSHNRAFESPHTRMRALKTVFTYVTSLIWQQLSWIVVPACLLLVLPP